jgi:hypothetical protein
MHRVHQQRVGRRDDRLWMMMPVPSEAGLSLGVSLRWRRRRTASATSKIEKSTWQLGR